jgi:hypothetical protein
MKIIRVALLVAALPLVGRAQDADQKAIIAVVDRLFEGMRKADTAVMRAVFVPQGARMLGINRGQFNAQPVDGWLAGIARVPQGTVYDERTWSPEVKVDGVIAQAWMQYAFYIGDRLSHCGVDAFDLVKIGAEWKIATVMDTRRNTGCNPPAGKH